MIHRPFYPLVADIIERDSVGRGRKGVDPERDRGW